MGEFFANLFKVTAIGLGVFAVMTLISGVCIWAGMAALFAAIF